MLFQSVKRYINYLVILLVLIVLVNLLVACTSNTSGTTFSTPRPTTIWESADYTSWYLNGLEVKPDTVIIGQGVEVSAWIFAPGIVLTDVTSIFSVDGERVSTKTIYIEGDSSHFISFNYSPVSVGIFKINFGAILTRDIDYYILDEKDLSTTLVVNE